MVSRAIFGGHCRPSRTGKLHPSPYNQRQSSIGSIDRSVIRASPCPTLEMLTLLQSIIQSGKKTENIWTKWPWTDCEKVLAKHGFELVLHPKIRTERHIFNRPGKHLLAPDIQALHLDLDNKYIDVVRVPRRNSSRSPSITPSERSRSSSSSSQTSSSSRSGSACQISPGHASEESEGAGISEAVSRDAPESSSSSSSSQKSASSGRPPTPSALGNLESDDFSDDSSVFLDI